MAAINSSANGTFLRSAVSTEHFANCSLSQSISADPACRRRLGRHRSELVAHRLRRVAAGHPASHPRQRGGGAARHPRQRLPYGVGHPRTSSGRRDQLGIRPALLGCRVAPRKTMSRQSEYRPVLAGCLVRRVRPRPGGWPGVVTRVAANGGIGPRSRSCVSKICRSQLPDKEAAVNVAESGHYRGLAAADRRYSAFSTEWETERTAGTPSGSWDPLFLVVGFDGTEPAQRALETAARLLHDRDGALEVVYVAHVPPGAPVSSELRDGFDDLAAHLASDVRERLGAHEPRWHFQRRDGTVSRELSGVAEELRRRYGPQARVAVIVGGSAHKGHHLLGSVSTSLERLDRFPVMVIP